MALARFATKKDVSYPLSPTATVHWNPQWCRGLPEYIHSIPLSHPLRESSILWRGEYHARGNTAQARNSTRFFGRSTFAWKQHIFTLWRSYRGLDVLVTWALAIVSAESKQGHAVLVHIFSKIFKRRAVLQEAYLPGKYRSFTTAMTALLCTLAFSLEESSQDG